MKIEDAKATTEKFIEFYDAMTFDLVPTVKQLQDDREAENFIKQWKEGPYSFKSLQSFIQSRYLYLYHQSTPAKKVRYERRLLLDFLFKEASFKDELYNIRKTFHLDNNSITNIELDSIDDALDILNLQDETLYKFVETVHSLCYDLKLDSDIWYDVMVCQIASPEVKQYKVVNSIQPLQHVMIDEVIGDSVTVTLFPGFTRQELDLLWRVLRPVRKHLKMKTRSDGAGGIWDLIELDRKSGLSWKQLGKKYDMESDTIRKKLKYDE